jgi:hypothetical protein
MRTDQYYYNLERASDTQAPEREKLEAQIKEYLAKGGQIKQIPRGVHAQNAEPMSAIRRRIEKEKNFGDDVEGI